MIAKSADASKYRCCVPSCGYLMFRAAKVKAPHPQLRDATVDTIANIQEPVCLGKACMGWIWTNETKDLGMCGAKPQADPVALGAADG